GPPSQRRRRMGLLDPAARSRSDTSRPTPALSARRDAATRHRRSGPTPPPRPPQSFLDRRRCCLTAAVSLDRRRCCLTAAVSLDRRRCFLTAQTLSCSFSCACFTAALRSSSFPS